MQAWAYTCNTIHLSYDPRNVCKACELHNDYFATFGSYRCLTGRYDNFTDVTFDVFSLNKSSGGLASQNHVE